MSNSHGRANPAVGGQVCNRVNVGNGRGVCGGIADSAWIGGDDHVAVNGKIIVRCFETCGKRDVSPRERVDDVWFPHWNEEGPGSWRFDGLDLVLFERRDKIVVDSLLEFQSLLVSGQVIATLDLRHPIEPRDNRLGHVDWDRAGVVPQLVAVGDELRCELIVPDEHSDVGDDVAALITLVGYFEDVTLGMRLHL